jgi:glycogen debranching enzyme
VALEYVVTVPQGDMIDVEFILAGGDGALDAIVHNFQHVCEHADDLHQAKHSRYTNMVSRSDIDIPDTGLQRTWDWMKCTYDWLIRDVPGVGRGLGAGLPDYPWWFGCDNTYALLGCLALGQHETAIETLDLIRHLSVTANGTTGG